jgi:hypothetical protein
LSALRRIDFAAWVFETDSIRIVGLTHIFGKRN